MAQPITLYFWPTPNGWKMTIALEEMGLPYRIEAVDIGKGEQFRPDYLAISPNNKMPAMIDPDGPDGEPIALFESGAMLLYLARKCSQLCPADERGRSEVEQWLMFQMGGLGPMCGQAMHFHNYAPVIAGDPEKVAYGLRRYTLEVDRLCGVMDRQLADREYLAGEYSIADIACWPWVVGLHHIDIRIDAFPNLRSWLERLALRPAVQRGMQVGSDIEQFFPVTESERDRQWRETLFMQSAESVRAAETQHRPR